VIAFTLAFDGITASLVVNLVLAILFAKSRKPVSVRLSAAMVHSHDVPKPKRGERRSFRLAPCRGLVRQIRVQTKSPWPATDRRSRMMVETL
jgi:hypothetical protein